MPIILFTITLIVAWYLLHTQYQKQPAANRSKWLWVRIFWIMSGVMLGASIIGRFNLFAALISFVVPVGAHYYFRLQAQTSKPNDQEPASTVQTEPMTEPFARELLNVSATATKEEIEIAYKSMIKKFHPDRGGNHYFAQQLNMARDTLMKKDTK